MGSGPPLVLLPGLAPENGRPRGLARNGELQTMAAVRTRLHHLLGRPGRAGLKRGTSFTELTAAPSPTRSRSEVHDQPVNVLGISTGGSIGQQLGGRSTPNSIDRLVLVSGGADSMITLLETQRAMIRIAATGRPRTSDGGLRLGCGAGLAWTLRGCCRHVPVRSLRLCPAARSTTSDLLVTLEAEDSFDLTATFQKRSLRPP